VFLFFDLLGNPNFHAVLESLNVRVLESLSS
jgi:hypothetical protein